MLTIEEFLRLSNRLREYYGKQIKDRGSLTPLFTTDLKHSA